MTKPAYPIRLAAEALGTFGFFLIGFSGLAAALQRPDAIGVGGVAAGFGLGLALMIFAFGHISGGHLNPAVSLGLACGRQFPWRELPGYWAAQVAGGIVAAAVARGLYSGVGDALVNAPTVGDGTAFAIEAIFTALFVLVISAVATDARAPWNGLFAPLAIGGFIFTAATVVGPFTSGSFNPARSLAPALLATQGTDLWLYLVAPLVGGAIGGALYIGARMGETHEEVPVTQVQTGSGARTADVAEPVEEPPAG